MENAGRRPRTGTETNTPTAAEAVAGTAVADGGTSGFGFKKRVKVGNARKRTAGDEAGDAAGGPDGAGDDGDDPTVVVRKERKVTAGPLVVTSAGHGGVSAGGQTNTGGRGEFELEVSYTSTLSAAASGSADQNATGTLDVDTARDRDAEALHQKQLAITKELEARGVVDDKIYRGQVGYTKFIKKEDAEHGAKYRVGPQRGSNNVRTTIRFDYQPDVCKDYKETGYCGYGDSCKFLHDRGDYKSGWQLDREWNERGKNKDDPNKYVIAEEEDEEVPFACLICRKDFTNPIVTRCSHYFCEKCALEQFRKTPKCFVCGEKTGGLFNTAKELLRKLEERKRRMKESSRNPLSEGEEEDASASAAAPAEGQPAGAAAP